MSTVMSKTALHTMSITALANRAGKSVVKAARSTVAARKAQLRADLEDFDVERLLSLQEEMARFIDLVTIPIGEDLILPDSSKLILMQQFLAKRNISEFADVIGEQVKAIVFAHIEAEAAADGEEDPANVNGSIEVPALGKKFSKEGAGYTTPTINETVLAQLLPADVVAEVFVTKEVIKVERSLDLPKLMALMGERPELMAVIGEALNPGIPKTQRLYVRDL